MIKRVLLILAALLVFKVTLTVVLGYRDYFPPNFQTDFLAGRQAYFFGPYAVAFYVHLCSGPISLLFGLLLISDAVRARFPLWHRRLGKVQVAQILLLITPSGLWMALHAHSGWIAAAGFAGLALATATCTVIGWRLAVLRRFAAHRRWMQRCFVLLCSAIVIRLVGGLTAVAGFSADWYYPLMAWACWLAPLAIYELAVRLMPVLPRLATARHSSPSLSTASSLPAIEIIARRSPADSSSLHCKKLTWPSANAACEPPA